MKINDFEFGLIGSVVYAGMAAGSVIASGLFNNASWIKSTIIGVVSLNAVAVWTFQMTRNFYFDLFVRFVKLFTGHYGLICLLIILKSHHG